MESWNPTFATVTELAGRVMGWYGFTEASNYLLLTDATRVAVELVSRGLTPATLTRQDIEAADASTGSVMRRMWEAVTGASYRFTPAPVPSGRP